MSTNFHWLARQQRRVIERQQPPVHELSKYDTRKINWPTWIVHWRGARCGASSRVAAVTVHAHGRPDCGTLVFQQYQVISARRWLLSCERSSLLRLLLGCVWCCVGVVFCVLFLRLFQRTYPCVHSPADVGEVGVVAARMGQARSETAERGRGADATPAGV